MKWTSVRIENGHIGCTGGKGVPKALYNDDDVTLRKHLLS